MTEGLPSGFMLGLGLTDPQSDTSQSVAFRKCHVNLVVDMALPIGVGGYRVCYAATLETLGMKVPVVAKQWKSHIYTACPSTYLWDAVVYLYAQSLISAFQQLITETPGFPESFAYEARKLRVSIKGSITFKSDATNLYLHVYFFVDGFSSRSVPGR